MAVKGKEVKGKQVAGKGSSGKRKRDDTDKSGGRKRKNSGVLQFFDVAAEVDEEDDKSEDDGFDDDDFLDEIDAELKDKNEAGKSHHLPFIPKEEELSDDELAELLKERYRRGSRHVVQAKDDYEAKNSVDGNGLMPSKDDPTIWRVKCMVGRERHSVFCLMQKNVDLKSLGTKLQTVSAFALEHVKGHIFVEAYREFDVIEACKGLCSIYSTRLAPVPRNEVSHVLSTRSKINDISLGSWARMKYGKYRGDLTQVVAVNAACKRATVKLIPRIDLQAIARKLSGGGSVKQTTIPAPRLISSSELEDFRKHLQCRHDRESGLYFEIIDGLMLKDGYLYKRVAIESLNCWGVVPSADELRRFEASKEQQSDDNMEWLSGLYGGGGRKRIMEVKKGKSSVFKDTSKTKQGSGFEVHNLVFFGQNDVGVITGVEDGNRFQILKDDEGGAETVTVELDDLRIGSDDRKFNHLDHHKKTISINDAVRVLEGLFKDRQGIVKQMYRGTLFIYDENQLESGGYFCSKSQFCEKFKHSKDASQEIVDDGPGSPGFQDSMASPKSPPSSPKSPPSKRPWVERSNLHDSNSNCRGDRDGIFSIGQTVRIRVGPLKGYLCRVIAIYRSDVTVKLDCQVKVITVKCEHLSEVCVKSCGRSFRDPDSNTEFGSQGWPKDMMDGKGAFGESNGWDSSGLSTGRNSWPDFSASGLSMKSPSVNLFGSTANDPKIDEGDDAWGSKLVSATGNKRTDSWGMAIGSSEDQNSTWDKVETKNKAMDAINDQVGSWGGSADCWDKATAKDGFGSSMSDDWNKAKFPIEGQAGCSRDTGENWDTVKFNSVCQPNCSNDAKECWNKAKSATETEEVIQKKSDDLWHKGEVSCDNNSSGWNSDALKQDRPNSWDKGKQIDGNDVTWVSALASQGKLNIVNANQEDSWNKAASTWKGKGGTTGSGTDWNSTTGAGVWGSAAGHSIAKGDQGSSWNKDKSYSGSQSEKWGDMKENCEGEPMGSNKSGDIWHKGEIGCEDHSSGWNFNAIRRDQPNSWDKGKQTNGKDDTWVTALDSQGKSKADNANQENSWGKATDAWKGKGATTGSKTDWNCAAGAGGWGNAAVCSMAKGDQGNRSNKDKGWSASKSEKWGNMKENCEGEPMGWRKSVDYNTATFRQNRPTSWDDGKSIEESEGACGRAVDSEGKANTDKVNLDDSWGKAFETGKAKDGSSRNKADGWNSATAASASQSENFSGNKGGWNKPWAAGAEKISTWSEGAAVNTEDETEGRKKDQNGSWSSARSFENDCGFGWNKVRVENKEGWGNRDQEGSGDSQKTFDGGRGPGGRRGRGRGRGRDNFSRERSYGWNNEGSNWSTISGGNQSRWSDGSNTSEGGGVDGLSNIKVPSDDQHTSWKSGTSDGRGNQTYGRNRVSNWNVPNAPPENQFGWQRGSSDEGGSQSGWDKSNWNTSKASAENQSGWNQGSGGTDAGGHEDQGDRWDRGKSSGGKNNGDPATGLKSGNASGGDSSSGWNKLENSSKGSDDQSNSWNRKTFETRDRVGDWVVKSFGGASGWSGGQTSDNEVVDPTSSSDQPRGFGVGHIRGGFENRGCGRGNQFSARGRGRGFGAEGSYRQNRNDSDGGWENSNRADGWNQGGSGNSSRGRREQSGGRGRGRSSGEEDSLQWNKNNSDGFGGHAGSWNQGSAGMQSWSVGNGGWSKNADGSTSEAAGASSLGKGKDESQWGNAAGSWGTGSSGQGKDENQWGKAAASFGASSSGKGKDGSQWGNDAGSWGTGSSGKGKDETQWGQATASFGAGFSGKGNDENQLGNAADSWGTRSFGKGKDENSWGDAGNSWGRGSDGRGPKSGW
ncbi:hypothetical protein NE237_009144 [Protea cynaroides]|uniref:KOW domain-containing protein n=1 Tax=Protea cynaroides TaxID=273540 RepID=A0A9Q0KXD7_9MAGN|nr:hypothetical protein NE237_009144 [Protea cynaroides]